MDPMNDMKAIDPFRPGADGPPADAGPVTREEFNALKAQVADIAGKVDADEQDDTEGDQGDDSIAGAATAKPAAAPMKQMVKAGGPMMAMKGARPPFSSR